MPGTALAWRTANIAQNAGQLWGNLAIPGAGARVTLHTDGTPESVANPNAFHYGATKAGSKVMVKSSFQKFNVDEFRGPIVTNLEAVEMGIAAELVGVTDLDVIKNLLAGVGSYSTAAGYKQVTIGQIALVYQSLALVFPLVEDVTKYGIFHLYSSLNDNGVEWAVGRKELGFTPANFLAYEIPSRAATDTLGNIWKQST